ncbi:hypothetical protein MUK42_13459 [Musa troglodytarum]|uniref:Uncharacterized protein n=1 Tax=Musa troglodytarum TaxID=320322 RepID=A0A9E7H4F4_9LILI|nr:hypothetical protein MUK42_13459 [Musa troglodytarum]
MCGFESSKAGVDRLRSFSGRLLRGKGFLAAAARPPRGRLSDQPEASSFRRRFSNFPIGGASAARPRSRRPRAQRSTRHFAPISAAAARRQPPRVPTRRASSVAAQLQVALTEPCTTAGESCTRSRSDGVVETLHKKKTPKGMKRAKPRGCKQSGAYPQHRLSGLGEQHLRGACIGPEPCRDGRPEVAGEALPTHTLSPGQAVPGPREVARARRDSPSFGKGGSSFPM